MGDPVLLAGLAALAGAAIGGVIAWLIRGSQGNRSLEEMDDLWQKRYDEVVRHRDKLAGESTSLRSTLNTEGTVLQKHKHAAAKSRVEIESLREKSSSLSKNLFTLGAERDELGQKLSRSHALVIAAKNRIADLQAEAEKTKERHDAQLESLSDERKLLERKIEGAKSEQESLRNLLMASKSEHESVSNMLASAQSRLDELSELELKVVSLEADNAELKHEAAQATREAESLRRDVAEMSALKEQNRELVHCLESMESSRKQYEDDARRYRDQYEQSEHESETLRFKLGDIEQNLVDLQQAESDARKVKAEVDGKTPSFGLKKPNGELDDLTEIVGIGKVFEKTLHDLGIYHFRQIAAFGPAEIARINTELKEFRGRIEQDDWIGQAKELHFRKYGNGGG